MAPFTTKPCAPSFLLCALIRMNLNEGMFVLLMCCSQLIPKILAYINHVFFILIYSLAPTYFTLYSLFSPWGLSESLTVVPECSICTEKCIFEWRIWRECLFVGIYSLCNACWFLNFKQPCRLWIQYFFMVCCVQWRNCVQKVSCFCIHASVSLD